MRRILGIALAIALCVVQAVAQEVEELGASSWAILSEDPRSSNSVVFGGEEYTLLVDPGRTPAIARKRIELAESLTGTRVQKVVLTSADASCALGVLLLAEREFEVSCHGEARRYLVRHASEILRTARENAKTPEEAAIFAARLFRLPDRSLEGIQRFHLGKHHLRSIYVSEARTPGDLIIQSSKDGVIAIGGLGFEGRIPPISNEANLRGWARGLRDLEAGANIKFVQAHGAVVGSPSIGVSREYLEALIAGPDAVSSFGAGWKVSPEYGCSDIAQNLVAAAACEKRTRVVVEPMGGGQDALGMWSGTRHFDSPALDGPLRSRSVWNPNQQVYVEVEDGFKLYEKRKHELLLELPLEEQAVGVDLTADGRLAFVPLGAQGRIACFDLYNQVRLPDALVGAGAGIGGFTLQDRDFVLPITSKGSLAFVNTASREISALLNKGMDSRPIGLVVTPNRKFGLVWYEDSSALTLVDLIARRVLARKEVEGPISYVAFRRDELEVSCEGAPDGRYYMVPKAWTQADQPQNSEPAEVAIMGMTHSQHLESELWGLEQVADTIRRFRPDAVLVEIPPNRWEKAWDDYCVRGVVEEARVKVFAEYREMMFDLSVELGFEIVPCAAWTKPMNDLRKSRLHEFDNADQWAESRRRLELESATVDERWKNSAVHDDDPHVIHSDEYDQYVREVMSPVAAFQNNMVGPGGWWHINNSHMGLVREAIRQRPGKRLLVTFGAFHKYMFLDELRTRTDIKLLELGPYLPE